MLNSVVDDRYTKYCKCGSKIESVKYVLQRKLKATLYLPILKNHGDDCINNGKYKNSFGCLIAVAIYVEGK